jgi:hypothetical protein
VSRMASGHEGNEGLVVEQDSDLLANLHDENVSNCSAFRLRQSRSKQAYILQTCAREVQEGCD